MTRTTKVLYNKFNRNDGNIKTVTFEDLITGEEATTTYTYDKLNQLTREDNQAGNFTYVWEYDDGGNILSRKKYAYTTGNLGAPTETVNYGYGNANWGDLLTSYNGQNITYDTIGNVLSDGTRTYTWEHGRELTTLTMDGKTWSYTYDANGMRTKRAYGSTVYQYVYNGSQLSQMTIGSNTLFFTYDASGMPMTVTYNGTVYYYVTNLQGDMVAILNNSGVVVVEYTYDAWGNVLSTTGSLKDSLGYYNPLRYRGYVYDTETGLYYLQSRYYNPEWGRFINADAFISTGQGLLGYNMFAYCLNNPICYHDDSGYMIEEDCVTDCPEELLFPDKEVLAASFALQSFFSNLMNRLANKISTRQSVTHLLPTEYYTQQKAPQYYTPHSDYTCISFNIHTHSYEISTAYYDFAGRQVYRIDWTNHGRGDHGNPHIHARIYSDQYPMGQKQERND